MDGSSLSSEDRGIHLTHDHDDILLKISRYFTKIDQVDALAIKLFLGSPTGGVAIVAQLEKDSTIENKALKVLHKWQTQYYDKAYGRCLYKVLTAVSPMAAEKCKSQLCPLNTAQVSPAPTISSLQTKRPCEVIAVWNSSSGRFAVNLAEQITSQLHDFQQHVSTLMTEFFNGLLGQTGKMSFLKESEGQPDNMQQLVCVSVAVKLDGDFTAAQLEQRLTWPLTGFIGLPFKDIQCHRVIPSKFGGVKCVLSLPVKKAKSLLQKWKDADRVQELQETFSDLPALVTQRKPISSITDTIDESLWGLNTLPVNPPQVRTTETATASPVCFGTPSFQESSNKENSAPVVQQSPAHQIPSNPSSTSTRQPLCSLSSSSPPPRPPPPQQRQQSNNQLQIPSLQEQVLLTPEFIKGRPHQMEDVRRKILGELSILRLPVQLSEHQAEVTPISVPILSSALPNPGQAVDASTAASSEGDTLLSRQARMSTKDVLPLDENVDCKSQQQSQRASDCNYDFCAICDDGGDDLLCCDSCELVYHLKCLDCEPPLTSVPVEEWLCPVCKWDESTTPYTPGQDLTSMRLPKAWTKKKLRHLDRTVVKTCYMLWSSLRCHVNSYLFRYPVKEEEAPCYFDHIEKPMDLSTAGKRFKNGSYKTVADFVSDLFLIFDNCDQYNKVSSEPAALGRFMRRFLCEKLQEMDLESLSKPEPLKYVAVQLHSPQALSEQNSIVPPSQSSTLKRVRKSMCSGLLEPPVKLSRQSI